MNDGEIEIEKVIGLINRADALTKPKDGRACYNISDGLVNVTSGRHAHAPRITKVDPFEENNDDDE